MCMLNEGIFWGMGGFKKDNRYWNCDAYPSDERTGPLLRKAACAR